MVTEKNRHWWIFASFAFVFIIINLDLSVVNIALPSITKDMHTSLTDMQWIINIFTLVMTCLLIFFGNLCDRYGSVNIYVLGNICFMVGSLISGIAPNTLTLIIGRIIQGTGMAAIFNPCILVPLSYFPDNQRAFVISCIASISGLAMAIGPNVGGYLVEYFSWRWIFLINVPLGIATIIMTKYLCEKDLPNKEKKVDLISAFYLATSIVLLLIAFNNLKSWGFSSLKFLTTIILSVVVFSLIYFRERNQPNKTIIFSSFLIKDYNIALASRFFVMYGFFLVLFLEPFYLENIRGMTPSQTGIMLLSFSGIFGLLSPFSGKICDKVGINLPIKVGLVTALFAFILMSLVGPESGLFLIVTGLMLLGMALAILIPPLSRIPTLTLPKHQLGNGMAIFFTMGFFGGSVGVGLSGSLLNLWNHQQLIKNLTDNHFNLSSITIAQLGNIVSGANPIRFVSRYVQPDQVEAITQLVKTSYLTGYHWTMLMMCAILFFCLFSSFFLSTGRKVSPK